ncbi:porin family protein [Rickettsiella grylli]|uniref:OmpA/MotB domain protein n=1 Tax=Rickettsiella grylli TaxID=59196 RepID=A8PML5_9COXI|nr:porin family protein [Rickettsiella grylli]EDP46883.1 putative OmpA/MotB domain protein [Rickettsiella grylli]
MLKKILMTGVLTASACAVITANAATPFYVHGQIGYADTHIKSRLESNPANFANDGLAGRLSLGYQLTPQLAVEAGYLQLSNENSNERSKKGKATFSNEQYAIDVAAKGALPITNNVNVYGKLGVAYLTTKLNPNDHEISKRKFAPEVAVGMDYDITPNVTVDTSLTHIQTFGSKRPGNIDFLAVGVGYNFG